MNLSTSHCVLFVSFLILCLTVQLASQEVTDKMATDEAILSAHGIDLDAKGIESILDRLTPDPELTKRAELLVSQLANSDYSVRESATNQLIEMRDVPTEILTRALSSSQPEVKIRSARIIESRSKGEKERAYQQTNLLVAAFNVVDRRKLQIPLERVLSTYELLEEDDRSKKAILRAIQSISAPNDMPSLRKMIASNDSDLKIAALKSLPKFASTEALELLRKIADEGKATVSTIAIHGLLELGDRRSLKKLVTSLDADDTQTRIDSLRILRSVSGENFGLDPFNPTDIQNAQRNRWQSWLAAQESLTAPNATIRYSKIELKPLTESLANGLITHFTMDKAEAQLVNSAEAGAHGRLHREVHRIDGVHGGAVRFIGAGVTGTSGGYAGLPFIDFNKLKAFTVGLWVKHEGLSQNQGEAFVCYGFDQASTTTGSLCIGTFYDTIHFRTGNGMLSIPHQKQDHDRWVHYAMAYSNGNLQVFRNGQLEKQGAVSVNVKGNKAALARHWWANGQATSTRFIGSIDDLRVYDRALSNEQIQWLVSQAEKQR